MANEKAQAKSPLVARSTLPILGILVFGFAARLGAALTLRFPLVTDSAGYDAFGQAFADTGRLLDRDGNPLTFRAPGYPFFVGIIYRLFGHHPTAVTVIQAVLGSVFILALYLFASKRFSRPVALWAAALYALSPVAIFSSGTLLTENFAGLLLLASSGLAVRAGERGSLRDAAACGLAASGMLLTRPGLFFFPVALGLSLLACRQWTLARRCRMMAVLLVVCGLGLVPWLVRNTLVLGIPTIATEGGATMYSSWVHGPGHLWGNSAVDDNTRLAATMTPVEADRFLARKAIEHIRRYPMTALSLIPQKLALLVVPWDWELFGRGHKSYNLHWPLVVALALWAFRDRSLRVSQIGWIVLLGFAGLIATAVVFYGIPRFRAPLEPLLIIPAALSIEALRTRLQTKRAGIRPERVSTA